MFIKNHQSFRQYKSGLFTLLLFVFISAAEIAAQPVAAPPAAAGGGEDFTWLYVSIFIIVLGLAGVIFWRLNNKEIEKGATSKNQQAGNDRELNSFDADKEFEWLRKNQNLVGRKNRTTSPRKKRQDNSTPTAAAARESDSDVPNNAVKKSPLLPIFSINRLEVARPFDVLPVSNDEDLMTAIEQSYDEFEEDEEVRNIAIRILAAFKKRNSIEALSQIALYDLSANLRSKAVAVLSDFDHESVFETILLANADPTREVRAAAARSLSKLGFDRSDSWTRIAETGEEGRMAQAARAAIESGFVDRSFDRLVHSDYKQAYEAFALMALLIKANEMEKIFAALEANQDMNVRRAILHVIKITKDRKALDGLYALLEKNTLPIEFQEEIDRTIEKIGFVTA